MSILESCCAQSPVRSVVQRGGHTPDFKFAHALLKQLLRLGFGSAALVVGLLLFSKQLLQREYDLIARFQLLGGSIHTGFAHRALASRGLHLTFIAEPAVFLEESSFLLAFKFSVVVFGGFQNFLEIAESASSSSFVCLQQSERHPSLAFAARARDQKLAWTLAAMAFLFATAALALLLDRYLEQREEEVAELSGFVCFVHFGHHHAGTLLAELLHRLRLHNRGRLAAS